MTEALAMDGITSRSKIAKDLWLIDKNGSFRDLADHVVAEWKFKGDEPFLNLASPYGEADKVAPGFLPGGSTRGGKVEWLIQNDAVQRGMLDMSTLKIREIRDP